MAANLASRLMEGELDRGYSPEYCLEQVASGNLMFCLELAIKMAERGYIPLEEMRGVVAQGLEVTLNETENHPCGEYLRDEPLQQLSDLEKGWAVGFKGVGVVPPTLVGDERYGGLRIRGDEEFRKAVIAGLEHIGRYSPFYLSYVQENIPTIVEGKGATAHIPGRKCEIPRYACEIPGYTFPSITAENIVHEAAHFEDYSRRNWLGKFAFLFGFSEPDVEPYALEHELAFVKVSNFDYEKKEITRIERMTQDLRKLPWHCFVFHRNPWQFIDTGY